MIRKYGDMIIACVPTYITYSHRQIQLSTVQSTIPCIFLKKDQWMMHQDLARSTQPWELHPSQAALALEEMQEQPDS